ncbi:MAG: hypothetical protein WDM81_05930 [Rhizomicrobium sp.]
MIDLPSWAIAVVLAAAFLLSLEGGWLAYHRLKRAEAGGSTGAGYIVGASLGLLSLLMGFTLALSLDRYEIRRNLVVDEASAISTVWLRDQLLDEPFRGHLAALLRDYVRERSSLASVGTTKTALDGADRRAEALQQRIWSQTSAALRAPGSSVLTTPILQATNAMFDLPSARRAALDAVVPPAVLWTLMIVAGISAATTGYGLAVGEHRHRFASSGLFVVAALIIGLIVELDEPRGGLIQVPQDPIDRVAASILQTPVAP